jgi:hypothetical protein
MWLLTCDIRQLNLDMCSSTATLQLGPERLIFMAIFPTATTAAATTTLTTTRHQRTLALRETIRPLQTYTAAHHGQTIQASQPEQIQRLKQANVSKTRLLK